MSLFLTMLPLYLIGNLHCMGMCGPIVALLGRHRHRYWYFAGRCTSFSLAGMLAGALGAVINVTLKSYHIPAVTSFVFGGAILLIGVASLFKWKPSLSILPNVQKNASLLLLRDQPLATYLFGLCTILLPCGQTIIVYSACALSGDPMVGLLNGFAFSVLTSPSLWLAMHASQWMTHWRRYESVLMGTLAIIVGTLAILRGLAEMELVPHLVLNPSAEIAYHIVIY